MIERAVGSRQGRCRLAGLVAFLAALLIAVGAFLPKTAFASQFVDVEGHWAQTQGVVDRAAASGLVKGIEKADGVYFEPDSPVTRAQVAVMLCRMAGAESVTDGRWPADTTGFLDVESNVWYSEALNWGKSVGVFNGSGGYARPNDPVTRQELCQLLANYEAKVLGVREQGDADRLLKYPDASQVADWAKASVALCVEQGLIGDSSSLRPNGDTTRAEAAKMLLVLMDGGSERADLLKAHFIDVGQGDAAFIELPGGKTMLIDAGPNEAGATVVAYIRSLGYSKIDYVVMTHPDADHVGGFISVLGSLEVGAIYAPNCSNNTRTWENVLDAIASAGLKVKSAEKLVGSAVAQGSGWSAVVRSPTSIGTDLNDDSAVIDLVYGETRYLFTGDASAGVLASAVSGHVDVLKVSHHGSKTGTSSALVASLTPSIAVISCGAGNSYGHPTALTLQLLANSDVYRTDLSGTVSCYSDGESVWTSTSPNAGQPGDGTQSEDTPSDGQSGTGQETDGSTTTVYITRTGAKYHYNWCSMLKRSKSLTGLSVSEAKAKGYDACKVCKPPA